MRRLSPLFVLCPLLSGFGLSAAAAQSADIPAPGTPQPPTTTPAALAAHPPAAEAPAPAAPTDVDLMRRVSDQTSARLTVGLPQYTPQKPAAPIPDDDQADPSDTDHPKNGIIRLPDYVVRERPPPVFTQKEILTKEARVQAMFKEHPGLNLFGLMPFASWNAPIALQIADEEDRLANISDLRDDAIAARNGGDKDESEYIKRETQQTYMHDVWGSNDENDGK